MACSLCTDGRVYATRRHQARRRERQLYAERLREGEPVGRGSEALPKLVFSRLVPGRRVCELRDASLGQGIALASVIGPLGRDAHRTAYAGHGYLQYRADRVRGVPAVGTGRGHLGRVSTSVQAEAPGQLLQRHGQRLQKIRRVGADPPAARRHGLRGCAGGRRGRHGPRGGPRARSPQQRRRPGLPRPRRARARPGCRRRPGGATELRRTEAGRG
mmetsp:Transcript_88531/g.253544  ORF Transcript_88531/g.253544 Transcript_88531/m.253544 type:complete len:216 (+) Transcript_88531:675-1322(+)